MSVPCGFTSKGLPVSMQIMEKPRGEAALLGAAKLFEEATATQVTRSKDVGITPQNL